MTSLVLDPGLGRELGWTRNPEGEGIRGEVIRAGPISMGEESGGVRPQGSNDSGLFYLRGRAGLPFMSRGRNLGTGLGVRKSSGHQP